VTPDDWIRLAPDAVTAVAALLGGTGAIIGVNTWKKQLRGQHAYDVARKTYLALLQVRETLDALRSPFFLPDEVWTAMKEDESSRSDPEEPREVDVSLSAYRHRWNAVVVPMQTLDMLVLEAEIVISPTIREVFGDLRKVVATVKVAMDHTMDRQKKKKNDATPLSDLDLRQYEILHVRGRNDPITKELEAVIAKFATLLRPHLGGSTKAV